jgi:DNA-binding XRE family transcriptional regulator
MAKEKNLSPAEKLAAEIKANGVKRKKTEGPRYYFPQNTLKKEREKLGLNINQAATGAGVGPSTLAAMEAGDNCNLAAAMRVAMFYGKEPEKLFGTLVLDARAKEQSVAANETTAPKGKTLVEILGNDPLTEPLPFASAEEVAFDGDSVT